MTDSASGEGTRRETSQKESREQSPDQGPDQGPLIWEWGDDPGALDALWSSGGLVAIPTESSYGLAVDPRDAGAVQDVLRIKGRSQAQPLLVVAGAMEDLERLGARLDLPALAPVLGAWPAPLTAVVPLERPLAASLGRATVAVRIPEHAPLRALLAGLGRAVTATSANRTGEAPITEAAALASLLAGARSAVIRESDLPGGPPSTLVAVRDGRLVVLREGRFPSARLLAR